MKGKPGSRSNDFNLTLRPRGRNRLIPFIPPEVRGRRGRPSHSHALQVNELALPLVALRGQEVFKVLDLVGQLRVQVELGLKLGDPVPGGGKEGGEIWI